MSVAISLMFVVLVICAVIWWMVDTTNKKIHEVKDKEHQKLFEAFTLEHNKQISYLEDVVEAFKKASLTDALTGLGNKRAFDEYLKELIDFFLVTGKTIREFSLARIGVIMIDLDNFKHINDTYGHAAGDEVLRGIAEVISDSFKRRVDKVYRVGGEEMIIILPDVSEEKLIELAEAACKAIAAKTFKFQATNAEFVEIHVTASMGIAFTEESNKVLGLADKADQAMYLAKTTGKNKVVHFKDVPQESVAICS